MQVVRTFRQAIMVPSNELIQSAGPTERFELSFILKLPDLRRVNSLEPGSVEWQPPPTE